MNSRPAVNLKDGDGGNNYTFSMFSELDESCAEPKFDNGLQGKSGLICILNTHIILRITKKEINMIIKINQVLFKFR